MIEQLSETNIEHCAELASQLWRHEDKNELLLYYKKMLTDNDATCFLYKDDDNYVGLIDLSLRKDYVEGTNTSPVAYIEGIYVSENYRRKKIAEQLTNAGEQWGKQNGCTEMASDCALDNTLSFNFHTGVGFKEAQRIICFVKNL